MNLIGTVITDAKNVKPFGNIDAERMKFSVNNDAEIMKHLNIY